MSENCTCEQAKCIHEVAAENAVWGEKGFDLPYTFNKVYFAEGIVETNHLGLDPEPETEQTEDPAEE